MGALQSVDTPDHWMKYVPEAFSTVSRFHINHIKINVIIATGHYVLPNPAEAYAWGV